MKKSALIATLLILAPLIAQATEESVSDTPAAMERSNPDNLNPDNSKPDNTNINKRDRDNQTLTPLDQSNTQADIKITQAIRRSIMKQDFSTDAKNIKIITQNGEVTLRGAVNNNAEAMKIAALAKAVPGIKALNNQLEVK